jgi:hypothetical protein
MFHVLLTSYEIVGKHLHEFTKLVRGRLRHRFVIRPPTIACGQTANPKPKP